ncbi:MAG TPA: type I DNA topoisomerase [Gemmatimonadales bacterium]|nr:type I DNA topoisomerase [Gemmatimonadales bacterium]
MATSKKKTATRARKPASKPAVDGDGATPTPARARRASARTSERAAGRASGNGTSLVIVESPTKAKTIGKYLGRGYEVKATIGHVRDLPTRKFGVEIDDARREFRPEYVTIKGKTKTLAEIRKAAKGAANVFLATDPDREGEAIAWHVAGQLDVPRDRIKRVLFEEITRSGVERAMAAPTTIDDRKVDAQQARRILDRIVGYKASPILWKTIQGGLSAGRVQTVALRLIVEREREIRAFTPQEYWSVEALLAKDGQEFEASLHKIDGHKPQLRTEAEARAVVEELGGMPFVVSRVERKKRNKRPGAPFTTSTLQQEASKQLGFSSRRTMRAAQDLYEGVEVGEEGPVGLITYMRTDSVRVSPEAIDAVRSFIGDTWGGRYLPDGPNVYASKGRTQEAHEAIRPTDVRRRPEDVQRYLEPDQFRLYQLIWQRFVASQMTPAVYDMTIVDFELGRYLVRATGSVPVFDGYHAVYHERREAEEGRSVEDLKQIPALAEGDRVDLLGLTPSQHFTQPPPRYSEASLVKELERLGIGRPSTYSAIISTLTARDYVRMENRRFVPTELGETVERVMVGNLPKIFDVGFTADMETELDKVEEGELSWQQVLWDFYRPFTEALDAVDINALVAEAYGMSPESLVRERCPTCGSAVELRTGRFGPYIACVNYKQGCDYAKSLKKAKTPDRPTDEKCHLCGSPMVIKTGRFGEFLACTTYPACKGTRAISLGLKCPKCEVGELAQRRTKRGKPFWGCVRYPACDFSTWNQPVGETCPRCGWVGMEKRVSKAQGERRTCLKCRYEEVVLEAEEAAIT